jgi:hypothetical protein
MTAHDNGTGVIPATSLCLYPRWQGCYVSIRYAGSNADGKLHIVDNLTRKSWVAETAMADVKWSKVQFVSHDDGIALEATPAVAGQPMVCDIEVAPVHPGNRLAGATRGGCRPCCSTAIAWRGSSSCRPSSAPLQGPERLLREEDVALLIKAAYDDATEAARADFMARVKPMPTSAWPWSRCSRWRPRGGGGGEHRQRRRVLAAPGAVPRGARAAPRAGRVGGRDPGNRSPTAGRPRAPVGAALQGARRLGHEDDPRVDRAPGVDEPGGGHRAGQVPKDTGNGDRRGAPGRAADVKRRRRRSARAAAAARAGVPVEAPGRARGRGRRGRHRGRRDLHIASRTAPASARGGAEAQEAAMSRVIWITLGTVLGVAGVGGRAALQPARERGEPGSGARARARDPPGRRRSSWPRCRRPAT